MNVVSSSQITLGIEVLERKGPGVFLDCGSNIGSCALSWAAMGHKVYAVEPMSYNVKLIRKVVVRSSFGYLNVKHVVKLNKQRAGIMTSQHPPPYDASRKSIC